MLIHYDNIPHIYIFSKANPLSKYLQRGEDPNFDQLLLSLREVASFCLRSLLTALNDWRKRQIKQIKTSPLWVAGSSGYINCFQSHCSPRVYQIVMCETVVARIVILETVDLCLCGSCHYFRNEK